MMEISTGYCSEKAISISRVVISRVKKVRKSLECQNEFLALRSFERSRAFIFLFLLYAYFMSEESKHLTISISASSVVKVILVCLLFVVLYIVRDIVLVVLTAILIASAVEPGARRLIGWGIPRTFSVFLIYVCLGAIFAGIIYLFVPLLLQDTSNFLSSVPQYADSISLWAPSGSQAITTAAQNVTPGITVSNTVVQQIASSSFSISNAISEINSAISNISGGFFNTVSFVFGGVLSFILIVVISFYLTVQENGIEKFLRIVTPIKHEKYAVDLWKRTQNKIGLWMQGQIVLMLLVGILVYLALTVLGVQNALLFAFLAGLMELIPLFGPVISAIPVVAATYVSGGVSFALVIVGVYLIIHQFENHLIYPLVVTKIVGVPPILVILSLIVGFELAGFLGIFLSVPISAALVEFVEDIQRNKIARAG